MFKSTIVKAILVIVGVILLAALLYQIPAINTRLSWRVDIALTYFRGVLHPAGALPAPISTPGVPTLGITPLPTQPASPTPAPLPPSIFTLTPTSTLTPPPTATPIPASVNLPASGWEQQDWNNCGPAALSMYLHFYGWEGNQFDIAAMLKPQRKDRNVNVEELVPYARNYAGWLHTQYRVGGDTELLKQFIAAGIPVMIESSFYFAGAYWPNDDLWAAHYLLVTGYDDAAGNFTVQDTYHGPNRLRDYETLDEYWQPFNRVYILIYLPAQEETVKSILGSRWDEAINRQQALEAAQAEIDANPGDAFAWFNLGTNQLYFERYAEAAEAYDQARTIGLPQRMLRYQFGPFFAYFHSGRIDELLTLTKYALQRTPTSEEALLWHGWALYREGDINGAVANFNAALEANYNYGDAQYALDFVMNQ
ncbi:MAG: C39 family peptidase [Chloroflexi bacterium]|nr:C39 family peptidase [Chloroflexota bacterium]